MPVSRWNGKDTRQIDLPTPGEFVVVKSKYGKDDKNEIQKRMISAAKMDPDGEMSGIDVGVAYDVSEFAVMEQMILEGRFQDEDTGEWIKITRQNKVQLLHSMDDDTKKFLVDKLNELYPTALTEQESLNSGSDGITPSSETEISHPKEFATP